MVGKGPKGEDTLFLLQKRGSATRVVPKGGGRGAKGNKAPTGGKGDVTSKWDPSGCARCGRSSHWAKECTALKDVDGNPPREKPPPKKKLPKGGKGRRTAYDLEDNTGEEEGAEGAGGEEDGEAELSELSL